MKKLIVFKLMFVLIFFHSSCYADKGLFWWDRNARFTQSAQKAIIFHNFKEEVLILETELQANIKTEVLEFIPFPYEPEVELAKGDPFKEMNKILDKKRLSFKTLYYKGSLVSEPVEVRESKKIGPHDVTVIKINSMEGFNEWIMSFLTKKGINIEAKTLKNISEIAEDYINRGIQYFVFDYVKLENISQKIEPLIYRFKTDKLYYPLKTSNTIGGDGRVEIIMITPGFFEDYEGELKELTKPFPHRSKSELSNYAIANIEELKSVYEKVFDFFAKDSKIYVQMLRYRGKYEFDDDLHIDLLKLSEEKLRLKKDLIEATLLAIRQNWKKIKEDQCAILTDEIKEKFKLWELKFSSMNAKDYRISNYFDQYDTVESEELKTVKAGIGPFYPPKKTKLKLSKTVKEGDIIENKNEWIHELYKIVKISERLNVKNLSDREVSIYIIYKDYVIWHDSPCLYRIDVRKPFPSIYYAYIDSE